MRFRCDRFLVACGTVSVTLSVVFYIRYGSTDAEFRGLSKKDLISLRTGVKHSETRNNLVEGTASATNRTRDLGSMKGRLTHVRDVCRKKEKEDFWKNLKPSAVVWSYNPLDIHNCLTPKVGCTYWKQVLRFLAGDFPKNINVTKPSDIDRNYVHYGGISAINKSSMANPITRTIMSGGHSFMFTRNPYSRLWSAYIDKMYLPDFWRTDAKAIVKRMRPNCTDNEIACPKDVTFKEFLEFIGNVYPNQLNEHWQPLAKMCSPCHVQYEFIGKLESFAEDTNIILDALGLQNVKERTATKLLRNIEEVEMITKYNFKLENAYPKGCFDKEDIAKRLWNTFQYNGYIYRDFDLPLLAMRKDNFTAHPIDVFTKHVVMTLLYQADQNIDKDLKTQKREMMTEAYRQIPLEIMKKIQKVYEFDFEMFQYDKTFPTLNEKTMKQANVSNLTP